MSYSKRVHFELGHDAASGRWYITGPAHLSNFRVALHAYDHVVAGEPPAANAMAKVAKDRYLRTAECFYFTFKGEEVAAICDLLNTQLRDTVWLKPESKAGRKRARKATKVSVTAAETLDAE
jgi:hypothetical protein